MITRFVQVLKYFRKISNAVKWTLFKEANRQILSFFRLENQTSEDGTHSKPAVTVHSESEDTIPRDSQSITELFNSPRSADSERDVNAYVEAKVQSMELERFSSKEASPIVHEEEMELSGSGGNDQGQQLTIVSCHTSSPIVTDRNEATNTSLTALESAVRVAMSLGTQLPELLPIAQQDPGNVTVTTVSTAEDNEFSVYEIPALPSTDLKARFLTDLSEGEKTAEVAIRVAHRCMSTIFSRLSLELRTGTTLIVALVDCHNKQQPPPRRRKTNCLSCQGDHELSSRHILRR